MRRRVLRYIHKWMCISCLLLFVLAVGCQQDVETPPPPKAPPASEWAREFNSPLGELSAERQEALIDWAIGSGGVGAAVGLTIGEFLLSQWLAPLSSEEGQGGSEMIPGLEGLQVDGWAQLTLPCTRGELSFSLLLSEEGIEPVMWGEMSQCEYPELGLAMDGSITLFIPRFSGLFSAGGWADNEPNGIWLWLEGEMAIDDFSAEVDTALEISASDGRAKTLYEEGETRFVISFEGLEDFEEIQSSLMTLTLLVDTGAASWRCSVEFRDCEEIEQ